MRNSRYAASDLPGFLKPGRSPVARASLRNLNEEVNTVAKETLTYKDRIILDPEIMVGKPVVKGTRIPVELVLDFLAHNPDLDEFFAAYPHLTLEDVKACLAYGKAAVERERTRAARQAAPPSVSQRSYEVSSG